jgi:hypothetical protein
MRPATPGTLLSILILATLSACGGSSGGGGGQNPGPPGAGQVHPDFLFDLRGANAMFGADGGSGGELSLEGIGRVDIEVYASGEIDAGFAPQSVAPSLGDNPLTLDADTVLRAFLNDPAVKPEAGTPYLVQSSSQLRLSDGDTSAFNDSEIVSGLQIEPGVVVTVGLNLPVADSHDDTPVQSGFTLTHDLVNAGTILPDDDISPPRSLRLRAGGQFIGESGSALRTDGANPGHAGGNVEIEAETIINRGLINTSGADRINIGGNAGNILLSATTSIENHGTLTSLGGDADTGPGGDGGNVRFVVEDGFVHNAGMIDASGGAGLPGGSGGDIEIDTRTSLEAVRNTGPLRSAGGDSQSDRGGDAGMIRLRAGAGDIYSNATLVLSGGANGSASGASEGGRLRISTESDTRTAGNVLLSGDVHLSGGPAQLIDSARGGHAGEAEVLIENESPGANTALIMLAGYAELRTGGGSGDQGRSTGDVSMRVEGSGRIFNEVPLHARGGTGFNGRGGQGGNIDLNVDWDGTAFPDGVAQVENRAALDVSAGNSFSAQSQSYRGGEVCLYAAGDVRHFGDILANGGNDLWDGAVATGNGQGSPGGAITIESESGMVEVRGNLDARGGNGSFRAGDGGNVSGYAVRIVGRDLVLEGDINADGGDALTDVELATFPGAGGDVEIFTDLSLQATGTISALGGSAGDDQAADGEILINGNLCPQLCTLPDDIAGP